MLSIDQVYLVAFILVYFVWGTMRGSREQIKHDLDSRKHSQQYDTVMKTRALESDQDSSLGLIN